MLKYNYKSWSDVPKNVEQFFYNNWFEEDATIQEVNDFLNDLDSWYSNQQIDMEDFFNNV